MSAGFSDPRWTHLGVFITLFLLVTVVVNGQIHRQYQNDWPYLEVDFAENSKLKSLERVQAFGAFGEHWPLTTERARGGAVGLMVLLVTLCAGAEIRLKRRVEPPREVRSEPRLDRLVTAPPPALTPLNSPVLPVPGSRVATRPTGTALTPAPVTSGATKRPTAPKQAPLVTLSHAVPAPVAPPDDKARRIAAIAHFEAGRYPAAVSAFQELLRQDAPDRTTIEAYLAASFLEMGQADMAAAALDDLQNRPVPDEPLYLVAYICSQRGLRREARDLFRKLHAQSPKFRDVAERIESLSEVQEAPLELQMASFLPQRYQEPVLVGQGGIGMVFRAKDTQLDKIVAVKMMLPIHKGNADLEQRFLREAQSLSQLNHPGLVTIFDMGKAVVPYIAMEFLEGKNLADRMREEQHTLKSVLKILRQAIEIMAYCHEQGVIHRDFKPENIFLTTRNEVKLVDFGLVRTADGSVLTRPGMALGSPPYMSPEALMGEIVDHRTDIYSVGVCLYSVCCGQMPFKSEAEHITVIPRPPRELNPALPAAMETAILKCLEKKVQDRHQSCADLLRELAPFVRS